MPVATRTSGGLKPIFGRTTIDLSYPLVAGLSNCWLFNEGAGTSLYDLGPKSQPLAAAAGTTVWTPNFRRGTCIDFTTGNLRFQLSPGSSTLGTDLFDNNTDSSLEVLVNDAGPNGNWEVIVQQGREGAAYWGLWHAGTNVWTFGTQAGNLAGASITAGEHHLVVTRTTGGARVVYVDGVSSANDTQATSAGNTDTFSIGQRIIGNEGYGGQIVFVRMYRKVLTASEVRLLYADPFAMFQAPLVRRWDTPAAVLPPGLGPNTGMTDMSSVNLAAMMR
jgi:hypothetical protein